MDTRTRYHLLRRGRIVSSADIPEGEEPEPYFDLRDRRLDDGTYGPDGFVVSDADWRARHWMRALR